MLNHYVVEHHFTWFIALVVIADIEVALWVIELTGAHDLLLLLIIDLYGQIAAFVPQVVFEPLTNLNLTNFSHLQAAHI